MIYAVKSRCQIIENYSNMHFVVNDLNKLSGSLKTTFSVDNPLLNHAFLWQVCC